MTVKAQHRISGLIGSVAAFLLLCGVPNLVSQEKISPLSDFQYKRDFAQYEAIKKETDAQKRADLLMGFVKEHPISRILLYAVTDYVECVKPEIEKKNLAKAGPMIEGLLAALPDEKTVREAGIPVGVEEFLKDQLIPSQKMLLSALVGVYYQSNNFPKAAEAAEKAYTLAPDKALLSVLADVYLRSQNTDKYLEYGRKILAEFPIEQAYTVALQMAQIHLQKQEAQPAIDLYSRVMEAYGDRTPPNVQEAAWNPTRAFAYGIIASGIYANKDYAKALELFEKSAKFDPQKDDAHCFIGMCKWQSKDPEGAIEAFARCVALNKTYAARAQKYLEELYKARHNNTLDGLDQVLAKAKSDLGIK